MNKIKAICWDLDGVILDAKDLHKEALNRALLFNGKQPISEEDHLSDFDGLPTKKKLEKLAMRGLLSPADFKFISDLKQDLTTELISKKCLPNANHLICMLHLKADGYRMAVCSNSIRRTVEVAMDVTCLGQYMEFTLSNQDVKKSKPDPEIYLKACEKMGLAPNEVLVVEDNKNGIKAATDAGCNVLVVDQGVNQVTYEFVKNKIKELENE